MPRLMLVEDVYGVEFHRQLLAKLGLSSNMPRIERIPAKECNPAVVRKVKAKLLGMGTLETAKVVVVLGSENQPPEHVKQRVLMHFEKDPQLSNRVRVAVVEPRHETWLCIGLGLDPHRCRAAPEDLIARARNLRTYEKHHLAKLAKNMDTQRLASLRDFREYLEAIEWLARDP